MDELNKRYFQSKLDEIYQDSKEDLMSDLRADAWSCESPVELLFLYACLMQTTGFSPRLNINPYARDLGVFVQETHNCVLLLSSPAPLVCPQVKIGPYRVDFLFGLRLFDQSVKLIAIECDGHDFHEKTKKQAAHDKGRDRYLKSHGIETLRFTGSEVWKSANGCLYEVLDHLTQADIISRIPHHLKYKIPFKDYEISLLRERADVNQADVDELEKFNWDTVQWTQMRPANAAIHANQPSHSGTYSQTK